ncbi:BolA family protein [Pseudidiomarina sediminum]|uniref:BolA family protein n=1 Tax=Pseudidiomarina sediminum TaxID=431675 RepID=UPI001C97A8C2|nr:BolA family protein [Pseudidiomarina sediminum]MBY6063547.1 BolA family transcriptional regulator [Pseudidiomarina sediminum]
MHATAELLQQRISEALTVTHLEVINESHLHGTPTDDSHFKVVVVSEAFAGQRLLARHRQINAAAATLLAGPIHALAIHTYTPDEWQQQSQAPDSPECLGGSKLDGHN